jgi:hypothetical protein
MVIDATGRSLLQHETTQDFAAAAPQGNAGGNIDLSQLGH